MPSVHCTRHGFTTFILAMSFELLRRLCNTPAPPGREHQFRTLVIEELSPYADEVRTDPMGNVFFVRKGKSQSPRTIMLAAHMDEISFLVRHITKEGFLYVQPLGGFDPRVLDAQRVWVHGRERIPGVFGTKPTHFTTPEERTKAVPLEDMFIDVGLPGDKVAELVRIGDPVTLERDLIEMGNFYTGKTLDDRVGVYVMIEAFKRFSSSQDTIVAVATVQEEVGVRGAKVAAFGLEPDIGIALDITIAADIPGIEERNWCVRLGEGTAIKIMDSYSISVRDWWNFCERSPKKAAFVTRWKFSLAAAPMPAVCNWHAAASLFAPFRSPVATHTRSSNRSIATTSLPASSWCGCSASNRTDSRFRNPRRHAPSSIVVVCACGKRCQKLRIVEDRLLVAPVLADVARRIVAALERLRSEHVVTEWNRRPNTGNDVAIERIEHAFDALSARRCPRDQFGDHRVVINRHNRAFLDARVVANALALGQDEPANGAGIGQKIVEDVFGADAAFDSVSTRFDDLGLSELKWFACGDAQLLLDEIYAGDHFGDGMLDLKPRVDFHEVERSIGIEQELDGSGVRVACSSHKCRGSFADALAKIG
jgi:endoglucanase